MSIVTRIRAEFDFLLTRGFTLAAESDGIAGTVAYRSPRMWISLEWDRSKPWLTFAPLHSSLDKIRWTTMDQFLTGSIHDELPPTEWREPALPTLAAFVRTHLAEIERQFSAPHLADTEAALRPLLEDRRRRVQDYWWDLVAEARGRPRTPTPSLKRPSPFLARVGPFIVVPLGIAVLVALVALDDAYPHVGFGRALGFASVAVPVLVTLYLLIARDWRERLNEWHNPSEP